MAHGLAHNGMNLIQRNNRVGIGIGIGVGVLYTSALIYIHIYTHIHIHMRSLLPKKKHFFRVDFCAVFY